MSLIWNELYCLNIFRILFLFNVNIYYLRPCGKINWMCLNVYANIYIYKYIYIYIHANIRQWFPLIIPTNSICFFPHADDNSKTINDNLNDNLKLVIGNPIVNWHILAVILTKTARYPRKINTPFWNVSIYYHIAKKMYAWFFSL